MSKFFSMWLRARNIKRWPLQSNLFESNNAEHSYEVAIISHMLGVIERDIFKDEEINPERMATKAIYHEADECSGLGDINTMAKNNDSETKKAFSRISQIFQEKLLNTLPDELKSSYHGLVFQDKKDKEGKLCKAADDISAYIEGVRELNCGNSEYEDAVAGSRKKIQQWVDEYPSVEYFQEKFMQDTTATVDKYFSKGETMSKVSAIAAETKAVAEDYLDSLSQPKM
jgi:5'-deoxynucleotidase